MRSSSPLEAKLTFSASARRSDVYFQTPWRVSVHVVTLQAYSPTSAFVVRSRRSLKTAGSIRVIRMRPESMRSLYLSLGIIAPFSFNDAMTLVLTWSAPDETGEKNQDTLNRSAQKRELLDTWHTSSVGSPKYWAMTGDFRVTLSAGSERNKRRIHQWKISYIISRHITSLASPTCVLRTDPWTVSLTTISAWPFCTFAVDFESVNAFYSLTLD